MKLINGILNEDIDLIKEALTEAPKCVNDEEKGLCGAFYAARGGNLEINKLMVINSMTSYNVLDENKRNVLFYAVESGNKDLCRYMVERVGISPLTCDINGMTAFEFAHEKKQTEILKFFEEYCGFKYEDGYKNPIRRGFFPDPSIVRVGEDYYMVNSTFVFFPCIPISHSKDLIHWEIIGHAITNPEWAELEGLDGGRGYWAPDISYYKGRFYICATYRNNDNEKIVRKQMVTSSERPEGPYEKPVFIEVDGIDPSIFNDDDGSRYMLLNRGASIFKLSDDAKERVSEVSLLYYGDNKRAPEGPHILKKDGWYYLFQAEGGTGTGHMISVSRSRELFGIYERCPYNPIMTYREAFNPYIRRCGHGKPVMTPDGRWFIVYLCGRLLNEKYTVLGRETCIDELEWTADGWPVINKGRGASSFAKKPFPNIENQDSNLLYNNPNDDFDGKNISDVWYSLRGRDKDSFELKNSSLVIKGGKYDLDSPKCGTVLVRRQESFDFEAETGMSFELGEGGSCGLTCYYDEYSYIKFGAVKESGKTYIEITERIGETTRHSLKQETTENELILKCVTKGLKRVFYVNGKYIYTINNAFYLSDEGVGFGKRFTGAMVGMYCVGEGSQGSFDSFNIKEK